MSQQTQSFTHTVSKGSRYNQIYVPCGLKSQFEAGDLVEVRLLKKKIRLHHSPLLPKLSNFKERLIKEVFEFLSKFKEVEQVIFFGSFLTKKADYRDIDIVIVLKKENEGLEKKISKELTETFSLKFHIISVEEKALQRALHTCPLTRSMFYHYISDKPFTVPRQYKFDKNHLKFLLMFPEDLLKIELDESRAYYDTLRRLICIEHFLRKNEIAPEKIDDIITEITGEQQAELLRTSEHIPPSIRESIKKIIKKKLQTINKRMEDMRGKEKRH